MIITHGYVYYANGKAAQDRVKRMKADKAENEQIARKPFIKYFLSSALLYGGMTATFAIFDIINRTFELVSPGYENGPDALLYSIVFLGLVYNMLRYAYWRYRFDISHQQQSSSTTRTITHH